jgi:CheY-like chemotaxis protein
MSTAPARILIAESDDDTRMFYCESLRSLRCDVVEASDGRQALVSALSQPPTLVITETRLPLIDGFSLCEVLRRDAATRHVPILVITGESQQEKLSRARAVGANAVIVKPCAPETLLSEVMRLCSVAPSTKRDGSARPKPAKARGAKSYERCATKTPPRPPPQARCPSCDGELRYTQSQIGGVSDQHPEQWDEFTCPTCRKIFEYRQRTRRFRRVS